MAFLWSLLLLATTVSARTVFSAVSVNGVYQGQGVGVRVPASNAPVTDITSPNIICNSGFLDPLSSNVISVPSGAQLTAHFHHTSKGYTGPDPADPLDPTNKGPVLIYLARIANALSSNVTGLNWFKVWEDGLNLASYQWASDRLFINKGNATFTLPSCLEPGNYLLRAESIGLLNAYQYPGAQMFMSCAQISIQPGASTIKAPSTVSFPGAYTADQVTTDIYGIFTPYIPPGPRSFTC